MRLRMMLCVFVTGFLMMDVLPAMAQQWWGEHVPANRDLYVGRPELWRWRTNYINLFNGQDLTGWHTTGDSKWTAEDMALVGRNGQGKKASLIITDEQYANFTLRFQFQIEPDPGKELKDWVDSGVFFRLPPGFKRADQEGFEMELPPHEDLEEPVGTIRHVARTYRGFSLPRFWNDAEIFCQGDYIRITVNGQIASETFSRRSMKGYIAFQHRKNGIVRFKDIQIQPLPDTPILPPTIEEQLANAPGSFKPLFNGKDLSGWSTPAPNKSKWHVEDGSITLDGDAGSGNLVHEGKFDNFILKLKFFMPDDGVNRDGNSGIFVRGAFDGGNNGLEAQIENVRDHGHWNPTGSIYDIAQALPFRFNYNDWNEYTIYMMGDRIKVYLNGKMTAAAMVPLPQLSSNGMKTYRPGHIKIQSHGPYYPLQLKDIEIKEVK